MTGRWAQVKIRRKVKAGGSKSKGRWPQVKIRRAVTVGLKVDWISCGRRLTKGSVK